MTPFRGSLLLCGFTITTFLTSPATGSATSTEGAPPCVPTVDVAVEPPAVNLTVACTQDRWIMSSVRAYAQGSDAWDSPSPEGVSTPGKPFHFTHTFEQPVWGRIDKICVSLDSWTQSPWRHEGVVYQNKCFTAG